METNSKEFDTIRLLQECDAGSKWQYPPLTKCWTVHREAP